MDQTGCRLSISAGGQGLPWLICSWAHGNRQPLALGKLGAFLGVSPWSCASLPWHCWAGCGAGTRRTGTVTPHGLGFVTAGAWQAPQGSGSSSSLLTAVNCRNPLRYVPSQDRCKCCSYCNTQLVQQTAFPPLLPAKDEHPRPVPLAAEVAGSPASRAVRCRGSGGGQGWVRTPQPAGSLPFGGSLPKHT